MSKCSTSMEGSAPRKPDIEEVAEGRRQIDPLQSCIEARCSKSNSERRVYLECIYSSCINGFRLGYRRDAESAGGLHQRAGDESVPRQRLSNLAHGVSSTPRPPTYTETNYRDTAYLPRPFERSYVDPRPSTDEEYLPDGRLSNYPGDFDDDSLALMPQPTADRFQELAAWPGVARKLAETVKRGSYSDVSEICMEYHCGTVPRGTISFYKCINTNRCVGRQ